MIRVVAFLSAFLLWIVQLAAQVQLEHPSQFYTNGKKVDGWTRNDQQGLSSTFWLVKNPANSLNYRQQVVIVYDRNPSELYYFDVSSGCLPGS